jgi:anti-sigma factor RsiW
MRCQKAQRLISAHLDEELPPGKQAGLAAHLNHCEACAAELKTSQETKEILTGMERFTAPTGFSRRVMTRLDQTEPARPFFVPLWLRFAEVTVLLLAIGSGLVFGRLLSLPAGPAGIGSTSASLSLDLFAPAPAGSLGGAYLAMLEDGHAQ